ncbi:MULTISPECIES: hypothetical protein [unclassified Pseudoalteromonas]|uniref:hypothetical protein n=1 Tax=unclassified Pseudoalteromonas TaxID=194690 RepID=UPI000CA17E37|nr:MULTISPECIES: hypothetical protein [unclassified Pseudoalteromonas]AUJ69941.1 hypothetical protein PNC201_08235 [Pseudoalteromonas sp. NC201]MCF2826463.1 hypothetical protein [Pseudoalteromonas sp. OF5H-5]MCF2833230.1 hypothetical protein [Pseudoalteromonas sp. DL2-H6]MCF7513077.1 hypothetical protein [Pseudoalteromonas sp. L7]MCF7525117.1 hypothetical protein [Pseudoalteromonas sp. L23]
MRKSSSGTRRLEEIEINETTVVEQIIALFLIAILILACDVACYAHLQLAFAKYQALQ